MDSNRTHDHWAGRQEACEPWCYYNPPTIASKQSISCHLKVDCHLFTTLQVSCPLVVHSDRLFVHLLMSSITFHSPSFNFSLTVVFIVFVSMNSTYCLSISPHPQFYFLFVCLLSKFLQNLVMLKIIIFDDSHFLLTVYVFRCYSLTFVKHTFLPFLFSFFLFPFHFCCIIIFICSKISPFTVMFIVSLPFSLPVIIVVTLAPSNI